MSKQSAQYIKVSQISRTEYEVSVVDMDGDHSVDSSYRNEVAAENRAEKLSKLCNCDWGQDY